MITQQFPYALVLIAAALAMLGLAHLGWRRQQVAGARPFVGMCLAVGLWCCATALEYVAIDPRLRIIAAQIEYLGIPFVPPFALLTAIGLSRIRVRWPKGALYFLWAIPIATTVLAWTNDAHRLLWSSIVPSGRSPEDPLLFSHGAWFWVNALYSYGLIAAGAILCLWGVRAYPELYRRQATILWVGALTPLAVNLLYIARIFPRTGQDPTPLAFAVTSLAWSWAFTRMRLFDLGPIAREFLIERMTDGVVVLDPLGRVVDLNPTACAALGWNDREPMGRQMSHLLPKNALGRADWTDTDGEEFQVELESPAHPQRTLEARSLPLRARRGEGLGWLVLLRDVTEQRAAEAALLDANTRLSLQLRQIETLHHELHDQAIRDSLTGLTNRRFLEECLEREIARCCRDESVLSIVVMDVDQFKMINDTYLHAVGDLVLRRLGRLLRERTRREEEASRLGGDEFVVVLPGATADQARRRAEEWRAEFVALGLPFSDAVMSATLSAGVASYPEHGSTTEELLRAADRALYCSKSLGRNTVMVAGRDRIIAEITRM